MKDKIINRTAKVVIIGGGYVGLPAAVRCASAGFETIIYDFDKKKVESIKKCKSYIKDVSDQEMRAVSGKLFACSDYFEDYKPGKSIGDADIFLICVPTPLDSLKDPDVSYVMSAAHDIVEMSSKHDGDLLVVLESTVYPGFTEEVLSYELRGLLVDNLMVAFSAERVDPGNEKFSTKNTPKVVGGENELAKETAVEFYKTIVDEVIPVSNCRVAEMTKILENSFRMINIGFINEMALACQKMDIDIWEVIEAANTKPFGFMKFTPGAGLGGHSSSKNDWGYFKINGKLMVDKVEKVFDNVRDGDKVEVISYDEGASKFEWKIASAFTKHMFKGDMCAVHVDGDFITEVTDKHPMLIYNPEKEILEEKFARNLTINDALPIFQEFGNMPLIKKVKRVEKTYYNDYVYSIEVPDNHNLVMGNGVLIHNCIPLDPHYLTWKLKTVGFDSKMINIASEINANMPEEIVRMAFEACNAIKKPINGSNILVVGVAYKPNIDDVRESPALDIIEKLHKQGANIKYHDPYVDKIRLSFGELKSTDLEVLYDCSIIVTGHDCVDYDKVIVNSNSIVDTRNILKDIRLPSSVIRFVL